MGSDGEEKSSRIKIYVVKLETTERSLKIIKQR